MMYSSHEINHSCLLVFIVCSTFQAGVFLLVGAEEDAWAARSCGCESKAPLLDMCVLETEMICRALLDVF